MMKLSFESSIMHSVLTTTVKLKCKAIFDLKWDVNYLIKHKYKFTHRGLNTQDLQAKLLFLVSFLI